MNMKEGKQQLKMGRSEIIFDFLSWVEHGQGLRREKCVSYFLVEPKVESILRQGGRLEPGVVKVYV